MNRPDPIAAQFASFRGVLGGMTLLMLLLSWPLWIPAGQFPQVPFVLGWPVLGRWGSGLIFGAIAVSLLAVTVGRGGRWAWGLALGGLLGLVLGDQGRLQPWVQQFLVVALAVLGCTPGRALSLARWATVVLYATSGLAKLDAAFVDELGATFLRAFGRLVAIDPTHWTPGARVAAILAMPIGELAVAVALAVPRLRWWGLAGSAIQHIATIAILGPWALDHSTIVLVWNAALLVENVILFGPDRGADRVAPPTALLAGFVVVALVGLERWGWVDSWPAHALYASHAERAAIYWPEDAATALPPAIRRWLGPPDAAGSCRLDLTAWSRAERGVPVYPQNRVACGIAEALLGRFGPSSGPPVRVVFWGRAGVAPHAPRVQNECINFGAIRRRGDRSWINAHPTASFAP